jgi:hypothetical protein
MVLVSLDKQGTPSVRAMICAAARGNALPPTICRGACGFPGGELRQINFAHV